MCLGRAVDCWCGTQGKEENAPQLKGPLYSWMSKVLMKWMKWRLALKCLIRGYMDLDCTVFHHILLFCRNILGFASRYFVYYNCQFCAWYFACCEVRIPGLSFWIWLKIIWKYLFFDTISYLWYGSWQCKLWCWWCCLVIMTGFRRKADDNAFISSLLYVEDLLSEFLARAV
jgi:hypothetical protein